MLFLCHSQLIRLWDKSVKHAAARNANGRKNTKHEPKEAVYPMVSAHAHNLLEKVGHADEHVLPKTRRPLGTIISRNIGVYLYRAKNNESVSVEAR